jgi:hypothetical protein
MNRHERRALEAIQRGASGIMGVKLKSYAEVHNIRIPDDVTTLEAMMRTISLIAERKLDELGGFDPFWLADTFEGGLVIFETANVPLNTREEKDFLIAQVRKVFRIKHVHRFVSAVEAWGSATVSAGQRPSEAPDRMEVVYIHGEDGFKRLGAVRYIVRADDSKPHLTALDEIVDEAAYGRGRFTDLLPERCDRSERVH